MSAKDGSTTCPFALNVYQGFKEERPPTMFPLLGLKDDPGGT